MITVEEAKHIILENTQDFEIEEIPFLQAIGGILKEDIVADRDFPPFNRVAMDGIAINYRFFEHGIRDFKIEGVQAAGSPQKTLDNAANCYEVMTGAVLPNNCDTVIRYEDVDINTLVATVTVDEIKEGQNIHRKGSDKNKDEVLIKKNAIISAAEIGVLATVGKATVKVAKQPKVMIVSTGDELVDVNENPLDHQIRRSNVYTLVSLLNNLKIQADTAHIADEKSVLKEKIESYLKQYDVLLFSGAVSKGKFDFLPEVLDELDVQKLFHRVSQRPGKPFWFGTTDNCNVFAFPGNPVSTFVNCLVYFYPWYYKSLDLQRETQTAILAKDIIFKPNLSCFMQVNLASKNGQVYATPIQGNGSGDLASLVEADGFIELPKTEEVTFKKGSVFPLLTYRV
ncbi:molybdopterin molybdotransferase MoeA [Tenacibaculum larymnensis]|uniref:Molybdopterin molybdenumtransferase n=1 Tax=Tenacibaculum larymnensis TaxID=2878201 RepID=A0A9X4IKJ4_9FLAO|nr:molybdopterin molybdotransferase MoeA [Tenacibaculum larymnensis]MDE1205553.1 molybdopterin molybdotransferase MoeA [Tenacibaculum larymnensis]